MNYNKNVYPKYLNKINSINEYGNYEKNIGKLKPRDLLKIERNMLEKVVYKKPPMDFLLTVVLTCSKINGQIYKR